MIKQISQPEFQKLADANAIVVEHDSVYAYDCIYNDNGDEIAFATYRVGREPFYFERGE
jgi:hypothetical protein